MLDIQSSLNCSGQSLKFLGILTIVSTLSFLFGTKFNLKEQSVSVVDTDAGLQRQPSEEESSRHVSICDRNKELTSFRSFCERNVTKSDAKDIILKSIFRGSSPYSEFPPPGSEIILNYTLRHGWGSTANVFSRLISEVQPDVIVELGTFMGASALHMANFSASIGLNPLILCVDDYRGWIGPLHKVMKRVPMINGHSMLLYLFMKNVIAEGFENNVLPVPYSVSHACDFFCTVGIKADLIEVDAGHTFHSAWLDINSAYPLLSSKGVMFGHDFKNKDVREAAQMFASLHNLWLERDGNHWILRTKQSG